MKKIGLQNRKVAQPGSKDKKTRKLVLGWLGSKRGKDGQVGNIQLRGQVGRRIPLSLGKAGF